MIFRIFGLCALLLTAGCSSLHSLLNFDPPQPPPPAATVATPVPEPAAVQPSDWCQRIAIDARDDAVASGFDAATQLRMAQQALQQCTAMAGPG